jgi:hypothetical protein
MLDKRNDFAQVSVFWNMKTPSLSLSVHTPLGTFVVLLQSVTEAI